MFVNGHDDTLHRHIQFLRGSRNNSQIGLMWYQPVQFALVDAVIRESLASNRPQCGYRFSKHRVAVHPDEVLSWGTPRDFEEILEFAVGVYVCRYDARRSTGLQQHGSGAIPE